MNMVDCEICEGTGFVLDSIAKKSCKECDGTGEREPEMVICNGCNGCGEGHAEGTTCRTCGGGGEIPE